MDSVKKGKNVIIAIIVMIISLEAILFSCAVFLFKDYGDVFTTIIRTFFECLIFYFLYKGHKWAKVLFAALLLIGGIYSIGISIFLIKSAVGLIITLPLGVLFIGIALTLILSKSINAFMSYQREKLKIAVEANISDQQESTDIKD